MAGLLATLPPPTISSGVPGGPRRGLRPWFAAPGSCLRVAAGYRARTAGRDPGCARSRRPCRRDGDRRKLPVPLPDSRSARRRGRPTGSTPALFADGGGGRMGGLGRPGRTARRAGPVQPGNVVPEPARRRPGHRLRLGEGVGRPVRPLYRDGPNTLAVSTGAAPTIFTGNAWCPRPAGRSRHHLEHQLRDEFSHLFANDWLATVGASVGSASDKPFETWSQVNFGVHASCGAGRRRNAWLFSLAYSPLASSGSGAASRSSGRRATGCGLNSACVPGHDHARCRLAVHCVVHAAHHVHAQLSYRVAPRCGCSPATTGAPRASGWPRNHQPADRFRTTTCA